MELNTKNLKYFVKSPQKFATKFKIFVSVTEWHQKALRRTIFSQTLF